MHKLNLRFTFALLILFCGIARADDVYYSVPLKELVIVDGKIPWSENRTQSWQDWSRVARLEPFARVDQPGAEAFLTFGSQNQINSTWESDNSLTDASLVVRAPASKDLTGRIYFPNADLTGMDPVKFTVKSAPVNADVRKLFFKGKLQRYRSLLNRRLPGSAWFRFQARQAALEAGEKTGDANNPNLNAAGSEDEMSKTIDLFSGGRAVSENLQLDRALFPRPGGDQTVPIDSIKGIDVKEMDWKPLIHDLHPATDKLALLIPGDQHGIFFPSFDAAMKSFDEADLRATPIFEQSESSPQDAGTRQRYRRQLCLPETDLARLLGPSVIAAMAITGSDPYLRVGSDLAVLFQPNGPLDLHAVLLSSMKIAAAKEAGFDGPATTVNGTVAGLTYTGFVSPTRRICAYLATVDGMQIVTNSLVQLQRFADVRTKKSSPISAAPEYTFFRNRYPTTDANETAFVILPDAAIRRWCSPRWRLADSRRTRAAAVMMDLQAQHADAIIAGNVPATQPTNEDDLKLTATGVQSPTYGTLEFMTPIAELSIDKVTPSESTMYQRWRDTYQQNWSNYFDPIGASFSVTPDKTAIDISVIPLITGSDYREIIDLSKGVKIAPDSGDRHTDLFHLAMALNRNSHLMKQGAGMLTGVGGIDIDPLSWIGPTVSLYLDHDPIWQQIASDPKPDQFLEKHINDFPVVLYLQSSNNFKLAGFLIAVHAFADASAPGMTVWTNVKYGPNTYTKIVPSDQAREGNTDFQNACICYAVVGGALVVSPNEAALQRAIDRHKTRAIAATQPTATQPIAAQPWLGENLCAQIDIATLQKVLANIVDHSYQSTAQDRAWANIPILNEWHQRFPNSDSMAVQQKLFQTELNDPAGGKYIWNHAVQSMESQNYGCPAKPKSGPIWPIGLTGIDLANFGITFEDQGMRAAAIFRKSSK